MARLKSFKAIDELVSGTADLGLGFIGGLKSIGTDVTATATNISGSVSDLSLIGKLNTNDMVEETKSTLTYEGTKRSFLAKAKLEALKSSLADNNVKAEIEDTIAQSVLADLKDDLL